MKRTLLLLISIFSMISGGCTGRHSPAPPPECRVVTEVEIRVENTPEAGLCRYTDPRKMTKALNCLRRLDPWNLPESDPETAPGARYRVTLRFSDGSEKAYEQIGLDFFREPSGRWLEIAPEEALRLPLLLAAVPSDTIL